MVWGWGIRRGSNATPETEYQLIPSASYRRFGNRIGINSLGMRGPEPAAVPGAAERRVLLIGDSVVYGNHFLDQSETIPLQLTGALADLPELGGCTPFVLAAAASSWGPVNQAAFLARTGPVGADLAVLIVSAHDLYDTPIPEDGVIPYRLSPSYGALHDAVQIVAERLARRLRETPPRLPAPVRQAATLRAVATMAQQMQAAGVPFLLVYHPTTREQAGGLAAQHGAFEAWARENDVPFAVLSAPDLDASQYRDRIHPEASGAATIARLLADLSAPYLAPCPD